MAFSAELIRSMMPESLNGKSYNSTPQTNQWIVIHNTAGGTAYSNTNFFHNGADGNYTCTHYVVDDKQIYQLLEDNWKGVHAGKGGREWTDNPIDATSCDNSNSIGIEVADGDSVDHLQAIENVIELTRYLMKQYNIDVDHVIRHGDTQAKPCPATIMELGKWPYIKEQLTERNTGNVPLPDFNNFTTVDMNGYSPGTPNLNTGAGGGAGQYGSSTGSVLHHAVVTPNSITTGSTDHVTYSNYSSFYGYLTYYYGLLYPQDIIPNVDHRYNIANMDKVTGACIIFLPPYNVCTLEEREAYFELWGWDRKYHYIIDPKYDVDANPADDEPDLTNAKHVSEMGATPEDPEAEVPGGETPENPDEETPDDNHPGDPGIDPDPEGPGDDNTDYPGAPPEEDEEDEELPDTDTNTDIQPRTRTIQPRVPEEPEDGTTPEAPEDGTDPENPDDPNNPGASGPGEISPGTTPSTGATIAPEEDNSIVIKGGFEKIENRLLQCYGLTDNDKNTYINRAIFNNKPTAHTIMIACFIPTHDELQELNITFDKVEKNIINAVSKILWANGLKAENLWREFDLNRAASPAIYLDRADWQDLLLEIDKQVVWRNKKYGTVFTKYEPYVAVIPDQSTGSGSLPGGGGTPSTPGGGGTPGELGSGNEVANQIYAYFTGAGYSPAAACGIIGNVAQESGFKPDAENPSSGAYGLFQWLHDRKTNFLNYLKSKSTTIQDVKAQCEWADLECQGKDSATVSQMNKRCGGLAGFKALTSVEDAVKYWRLCFERCGEGEANDQNRINKAKEYYSYVTSGSNNQTTPDTGTESEPAPTSMLLSTRTVQPRSAQFSWPTPTHTTISSPFGPRVPPCPGASDYHGGIDISCPIGTDVHATAGGTVTLAQYSSSAGNYIIIDHGNGWGSRYLHLDKFLVSKGDTVTANQVIAKSGNTGIGTGAHLHFEIQKDFKGTSGTKVDPEQYVTPGQVVDNPGGGGGVKASLDGALLIGDSLTVGMEPILEGKYPNANAMGKGGKWAKHWLEDLGSLPAADSVTCVIQWLGINGVHNNESNMKDSQELLTKLKEKYPGIPIFNMNIFPTAEAYEYNGYTGEWWRGLSQEFNSGMSSWCSSNGVTQIDATSGMILSDGFLDPSKATDNLHFTQDGYKQVLANLEGAINSYNSSNGNNGNNGGLGGTGGSSAPLINSLFGLIENPGPAAELPYTGNSMGGLEHDDWGGKMTYYIGDPEDESAEKPTIEVVLSVSEFQTFCDTYFKGERYNSDGTIDIVTNFNQYWELMDLYAGEQEPYDKGLVSTKEAGITPNERLSAMTTNFTTDNENSFHFNVLESGPGTADHCAKAADELNYIIVPKDLKVEPIYPDLIIPPQYNTAGHDTVSENTIPLCMIETLEDSTAFTKQLSFDYDLLNDIKKESNKRSGPINFMDPYPTDDKIEELEQHYPKVFIDEIEAQLYSCNHPGCPIAQPMAKNFAMLSDAIMNQSKRVEKRLVRLENVLSTIMRNQARLSSRININCVYYGGQSTYAGKYKCIRCMHDDRINDGAIVTLDQCLNCTRYEPILGQIYQILDESGFNGSVILDDMQMSYSDLTTFKKLNRQIDRSPRYEYVEVNSDSVGIKPAQTRIDIWKEANKQAYLASNPEERINDGLFSANDPHKGQMTVTDPVETPSTEDQSPADLDDPSIEDMDPEIEAAREANYIFRMNWNETFFNSQQPDTKPYPTEGIIMRFKKQSGDLSYTQEIADLDPELDADAISDLQRAMMIANNEWTETREEAETTQVNKYSSEKFYFKGFAEIKAFDPSMIGSNYGNGGAPGSGSLPGNVVASQCRNKIVEMAKIWLQECQEGKAWYNTPSPRTVDNTDPKYSGGKKVTDCTGLVSCCYMHAGLKSMYAKSASGGSLMDEIVNNNGKMWLMDQAGIANALPGDVLVRTKSGRTVTQADMGTKVPIEHAMVYIGNSQVIHASGKSRGIVQNGLDNYSANTHIFVRPSDLIEADKLATQEANNGSSGQVEETPGTINGQNYVAKIPGAVCTSYNETGAGASGMGCEFNKTCASHNLPYGTKVYIPGAQAITGGDGIYTVTDTGGPLFDFDICTNKNISKTTYDAYIVEWGSGKAAGSYTYFINYYLERGTWEQYIPAWRNYKSMGGKLISYTKYNQDDVNITSHPHYND